MGDKINLTLDERELQGKKVRKLREQGIVPAVVYGHGTDPVNVQAAYNVVEKVVREAGRHTPVHLTIGSKKKIAMIKDVEKSPATAMIQHVSFHAVKQNEPVTADIPIRLVGEGESEAEKAGLIVLQALDKVEVRALPLNLPEALEVSVAGLQEVGDHVTLGDITLPEGVELVEHTDGHEVEEDAPKLTDLVVANVYEPSALQAAHEAAGGDAEEGDEVEAENGNDEPIEGTQAEETRPGGKLQDEPKQSNVDANK